MLGPWARIYNRYLAMGHDNGSAAYAANKAEKRCAANCPSTHCNRSAECRSPSECSAKRTLATLETED